VLLNKYRELFNPHCMATKPVLITQKLGRAEDKATGCWKRLPLYMLLHSPATAGLISRVLSRLEHEGMVQILTSH